MKASPSLTFRIFLFTMPHSVHSASSLEDGSGDPLQGSLTGLSLTDTRETETVASDPVQSIEDLTRDVIPQHLARLQQSRRFTLDETDALYVQGRHFQGKWRVSEEGSSIGRHYCPVGSISQL